MTRSLADRDGSSQLGATLALAALCAGCAAAPTPRHPATADAALTLPAAALGTQRLYRFQVDGFDAPGSGRLSLRLWSPSRFRVQVSDSFGTSRWSIEVNEATISWTDLRRQLICSDGPQDLEAALGLPLRVRDLPRVLLGRLPLPPGARRDGAAWKSADGWRWTARIEGGALGAWTAWEGDEPRLWWQRSEHGGVLSARRPSGQIRWREVGVEPLDEEAPPSRVGELPGGRCFADLAS